MYFFPYILSNTLKVGICLYMFMYTYIYKYISMCVCVCDESEKEIFNQMKCAYQYIITI